MAQETKCDRCGKTISRRDESVLDFLKEEYPGQDICPNCDIDIMLAASCARQDAKKNLSPGITAQMMLKRYESK